MTPEDKAQSITPLETVSVAPKQKQDHKDSDPL